MNRTATALLVGAAALAAALVLFITASGVGVSPDSIAYVAGARSIGAGGGFGWPRPDYTLIPITHFPPLYSAALAALVPFGLDPLDGARWLNAFLFAAYVALASFAVWSETRSLVGTAAMAVLALVSAPLLEVYSMAWSEALFLPLGLGVILLLRRHNRTPSLVALVTAAALAALATLARYAGVAVILAGVLVVAASRRDLRTVARETILFAAIALAPIALWIYGRDVGSHDINRSLGVYPLGTGDLRMAWTTAATWVAPQAADPGAIALWLGFLVILVFLVRDEARRGDERSSAGLNGIATLFATVYLLFIVGSRIFADAHIPFDSRLLSPTYAWFSIALVSALSAQPAPAAARWPRPAGFGLLALILVNHASYSTAWGTRAHDAGLGLNTPTWRDSPVLAAVRELPATTRLYSNGSDLVYLFTGRPTASVPPRLSPNTREPNANFDNDVEELRRLVACEGAALVHLNGVTWRWYLPSEDELRQIVPLKPTRTEADGTIYGFEGRPKCQ